MARTRSFRRPRLGVVPRRLTITITAAVVIFAFTAALANASTTDYYYGYNYLAPSSPTACSAWWGSGCAWGSFNTWSWTGIDKNSGDCITLGFADSNNNLYYGTSAFCSGYNGMTFHITRTSVGAPSYNRAFCAYQGGNSSYARCWEEIP